MRAIQFRSQAVRACAVAFAVFATAVSAQETQQLEPVEVTTAKIPISINDAAATITIVTGDELRARNATDLRTALSLVAGVDIAPGGDAGPTVVGAVAVGPSRVRCVPARRRRHSVGRRVHAGARFARRRERRAHRSAEGRGAGQLRCDELRRRDPRDPLRRRARHATRRGRHRFTRQRARFGVPAVFRSGRAVAAVADVRR